MMEMLFCFDIPVYRLPKEQYYAERESSIEKQMYGADLKEIAIRKAFYERNADSAILFRNHLEKTYGGPWDFNEIVGYIRRHFLGSQIRGELSMVSKRRSVRTRQQLFLYQTHKVVPEKGIPFPASNEEIYRIIFGYLEDAKKELKGSLLIPPPSSVSADTLPGMPLKITPNHGMEPTPSSVRYAHASRCRSCLAVRLLRRVVYGGGFLAGKPHQPTEAFSEEGRQWTRPNCRSLWASWSPTWVGPR